MMTAEPEVDRSRLNAELVSTGGSTGGSGTPGVSSTVPLLRFPMIWKLSEPAYTHAPCSRRDGDGEFMDDADTIIAEDRL